MSAIKHTKNKYVTVGVLALLASFWSSEKGADAVGVGEILFEPVPLVVSKVLNAKSTQAVFKVVNKTLRKLPKNRELVRPS